MYSVRVLLISKLYVVGCEVNGLTQVYGLNLQEIIIADI